MARVNNFSSHYCQLRLEVFDLLGRDLEVVVGQHGEVRHLAFIESAFSAILGGEPTAALRVKPQRLFSCHPVLLRIKLQSSNRPSRYEPVEGHEWIKAGDAGRISSGTHRAPQVQHPPNGWRLA